MEYIILLAVILTSCYLTDGQCTFPDTFNGTWITSYDGTWEINATHLLNYRAISPSGVFLDVLNPTLDFTCFIQDGTKYVLRYLFYGTPKRNLTDQILPLKHIGIKTEADSYNASITEVEIFVGFSRFMHTCLDIREITASKYVYYYGTEADNVGLRFTVSNTTAEVCTQTSHDLAYFQHIALQNGSETSGQTLCPPSLFGSYFYNTCNDSNSNTTSMDVCASRQQLIFNYTLCNTTQMFTSDGVLDCLFYDTIDSVSYLTVYNRDTNTPDGSNTYLFVCLAVELSGSTVQVSAHPESCVENQTTTNISSPGQIIEFTPYFLCPFTDEESSFNWMLVIYGAAGLVLLILLIVITCCCCKRCKKCRRKKRKKKKRKKKKRDEEAPSDDEDSESSASSESTRSSAASSRTDEQSIEQEIEKKSVDSGISEPAVTQRTESKITGEDEDGRTEKELVIDDENDKEVDDRVSRPYTGERSRMSDLPPSTLPDDEKPGTSHSDHEEKSTQDEQNQQEEKSIDVTNDEENENIEDGESGEETDGDESENNGDDSNNFEENKMETVDDEEVDDKQTNGKDEDTHSNAKSENDRISDHDLDNQPDMQNKEEIQSISHMEEGKQEMSEENKISLGNENDPNEEAMEAPESRLSPQDSDLEKEMTTALIVKQTSAIGKNGETDTSNDERQDERVSREENKSTALEKDTKQEPEMEIHQKEATEQKSNGIKEDLEKIEEKGEESEEEEEDYDEEEVEGDEEETDIDIDNEDERQSHVVSQNENDANEDSVKQSENQNKEQEAIKIDENDTTSESLNRTVNDTAKDTQDNVGPLSENQETQEDYKYMESSEQINIQEKTGTESNKIDKQPTTPDYKDMEIPQMPLPIKDTGRHITEQAESDQEAEHSETDSRQPEGQTDNEEQEDKAGSDEEERPKTQVHGKRKRKKQQREQTPEESDKQYNKVGKKKEKERQSSKPLTTVLLSRKEEEKKRNKSKGGSKTQTMTKLAKSRTKKFIAKDANNRELDNVDLEDELYSSEEETKLAPVGRSAPFIAQYNNKKRIEHILEQQHYWSDPEADRESFGINKSMTSIPGDGSGDSASEYEEIIGQDGVVYRVKRSKQVDVVDETNSEPPPSTKREKSFDSMTSVEDPESPGGHVSKKRLNDQMKEREKEMTKDNGEIQTNDTAENVANGAKSKTKLILVKENVSSKKSRRNKNGEDDKDSVNDSSPVASDFGESEIDKLSERDSGLDEDEEEAVDVVLNKEQQAMIVSMLFDKEMNLRPQFARDEDGSIIRRLDNTVIYDPHTGRFTFHKQLGKIFNVPRLKRDGKGRPIGGYVQDSFGPRESEMQQRTPSSRIKHRTSSGRSIQTPFSSNSGTPSPDLKRSRGEVRNVGFLMPDDDAESWTTDQLDMHKRGRRDIGSALRRKLNKRLFRKKRQGTVDDVLPDVSLKKAWAQQDGALKTTQDVTLGSRGVSSLNVPYSRTGTARATPSAQRRPLGTANSEQQQMYRQGLERDKKILEGRQDIKNKNSLGGFDQETLDEDSMSNLNEDQENFENVPNRPSIYSSHSFYTEDGRLVIRERGCPDLQETMNPKPLQRPSTFFTVVRSKEDLEEEITNEVNMDNTEVDRNCKSAPSIEHQGIDPRYKKENTFHLARRESQLSGIDNGKLRKLLEELYKDKKYFDEYIESKEPESEEFIHSKGLAEHGRGYLIERAEFWDKRGPLPPKPPMTDIGWKMYRQQTMLESKLNTDHSSKMSISEGKGESDVLPGVILSQGVDDNGCNESKA